MTYYGLAPQRVYVFGAVLGAAEGALLGALAGAEMGLVFGICFGMIIRTAFSNWLWLLGRQLGNLVLKIATAILFEAVATSIIGLAVMTYANRFPPGLQRLLACALICLPLIQWITIARERSRLKGPPHSSNGI